MIEADMTTGDVAAALRLNKATVQRLLKTGRLSGYQIGRAWRIPVRSLEVFRAHGANLERGRDALPKPISVTEDYDQWERFLLAEDNLADAPAIPLEAMRRENLYEGRD